MLVVIRGAGDLATGIALRLHRAGYQIVMTDLPAPTSIRRTVCFSEAIRLGEMTVEDISARKAETPEEALTLAQSGVVAVLADPAGACIPTLRPGAVVDAILAKKNLGTALTDAPVVIGVGPGFTVGTDCHAAVETMRGHTLGRALYTGSPLPNTGIPGLIGGRSGERVLRAPADGIFEPRMEIGQLVQEGEIAATVVEDAFDALKAPILRIGAPFCPSPFSPTLEPQVRLSDEKITRDLLKLLEYP